MIRPQWWQELRLWVLLFYLKARKRNLGKPLKEFVIPAVYGTQKTGVRIIPEKPKGWELALEEVAVGYSLGSSCPFRVCHSRSCDIPQRSRLGR